jgi:DNA-binding CsgD family transcriptional regulator
MNKLDKSIADHDKISSQVEIRPEDVDYSVAEKYIPFFKLLDSLNFSIVVVQDFYKNNYYYASERFNEIFGFHTNKIQLTDHYWFRSRFHPEDYIINTASIEARKYLSRQPAESRTNFKLVHEFRIKNDNDEWIRMIVQDQNIELDTKGNLWLNMKLIDLSPVQDLETPGKTVFRNMTTGEVIFTFEGKKEKNAENLSDREKQVLGMVAKGLRSKEISNQLFISVNTVNNHRKNLLKKLGVSNSSEAVNTAIKLGIV